MKCLAVQQIAEAATTTADVASHLDECLDCKRLVAEQRALGALLKRLPTPALTASRRRDLAAEVLAAAEHAPRRRNTFWIGAASGLAAAAAVVVLWLRPGDVASTQVELSGIPARDEAVTSSHQVAMLEALPPLSPARIDEAHARLTREVVADREVVTLTDGVVTIDSRDARNTDVRVAETIVHVEGANVRVHARRGVITSVQVIAGSVEIVTASQRMQIERGAIWSAEPTLTTRSVRAFRDGWIALRAGRNLEAISFFDAATDPTVAEDATYWAAIAAKRAGSTDDANQRLGDFLRRYPSSPHAQQAQRLLAR